MSKVTFNNSNNEFYQSLKKSIDDYFASRRLKKTGNWRLYSKAVILILLAIGLYICLMTLHLPVLASIGICMVMGVTLASIGFNVMHDACHGSFSSKEWVNNSVGMSLNALGAVSFFWKQKHNIIHHTYTNIDGIDDDIAKSPVIQIGRAHV